MKHYIVPSQPAARQMSLLLDCQRLDGLSEVQRNEAVLTLAQILTQAAGLVVEELCDERK
jgi:hypothetical protein